jgi:hypothetical protein
MTPENNTAYVYIHKTLDTNEIFYVGVGGLGDFDNFKRAKTRHKGQRNIFWLNIVKKHGFIYEIYEFNLSNTAALDLEKLLIYNYGRRNLGVGALVNLTMGGEGTSGRIKSDVELENQRIRMLGNTYPTIQSVINLFNIKSLSKKLNGNYNNNTSFRLLDKQYEPVSISKGIGRKVIDTVTGIIYPTVTQAAKDINISHNTLRDYLNGLYNNKTNLKYLYE